MPFIKTIATSLCLVATIQSSQISAQTTEGSVKFNALKVEGLVVGKRLKIGADFAAEHDIAVPVGFAFTIPTDRTKNIKVLAAPGGTGIYKVSFATEDNKLKSNLQFVPFTLGQGTKDERDNGMVRVINQAFAASVPDQDKAEINVTRATKIGPYNAIEAIGRYDGGADGIVALRVVAVIEAGSGDGLIAIINALPKTTAMKEVGDIIYVDGSRALGTLRFE